MSAIAFFSDLAPNFDREAVEAIPGYREFWCWVEAWLRTEFSQSDKHLDVLHLGCATGKGLEVVRNALGAHRVDLHGVDGSAEMIALAEKRVPEARFVRYDLENGMPIVTVPYDIVFMCWVLQFVENRDEVLDDVIASTKRPGWVFLAEKNAQSPTEEVAYKLWRRQTQSLWYMNKKTAILEDIMKVQDKFSVLQRVQQVAPKAVIHPVISVLGFNSWLIELPDES